LTNFLIYYWQLQVRLGIQKKTPLFYKAELYVFHKRKFPKLTPEMLVSFVNEAPGASFTMLTYGKSQVSAKF
jgi:hypothetical protein